MFILRKEKDDKEWSVYAEYGDPVKARSDYQYLSTVGTPQSGTAYKLVN